MLDRLDGAYSHVSRFSADAAHELRTPLTIIRGELELVAAGEKLPDDVDQAISNALEEMTRLSGIVDSLITLSRMESMWGKRVHAPVDLKALAERDHRPDEFAGARKRHDLHDPSGKCRVIVAGDRERLKQVLVNLIDNAIKYTPRRRAGVSVEVGIEGENGFVAVEDSGIGIDPTHHDTGFRPLLPRFARPRRTSARGWGWRSSSPSATPMAARSCCAACRRFGSCFQHGDSAGIGGKQNGRRGKRGGQCPVAS